MTWPLDIRTELLIGGVWTDISGDVRTSADITLVRGRQNPTAQPEPAHGSLTLNNRHGNYSPDNPSGLYYGLLDQNIPIRISVPAASSYLLMPGLDDEAATVTTPDAAALDITADIDIRLDAQLDNWIPRTNTDITELAGKWVTAGNQQSWRLAVNSSFGGLALRWTPDGTTASSLAVNGTVPLPVPGNGRLAVRATLDVNNGLGGYTVTFYTATSLAGPWTQLDQAVTTAGTTSIFNSTAPLEIGSITALPYATTAFQPAQGRIYGFELRSGIGGTAVASPDFTTQPAGTTGFTDAAGRTWSLTGTTLITDRDYRASLQISTLPADWDPSGNDVFVPVQASGLRQQLGQGQKALPSTLRRRIPSFAPLAYWPMEEAAAATQAYSPIAGVRPLTARGFLWAQAASLASSGALPTLSSQTGAGAPAMRGLVPAPAAAITGWQVRWVYRLNTVPATLRTMMRITSTGTVAEWNLQSRGDLSRLTALDDSGATVVTQDIGTGADLFNQWIDVNLSVTAAGGTVTWTVTWQDVGGDAGSATASFAGTLGRPTSVGSPPLGYSSDLDGMAIGHISAFGTATTDAYTGAITAYAGERAGSRMLRLAAEAAVPLSVRGIISSEQQVGPQTISTFLQLVQAAAAADGGILHEHRHTMGLLYRDRDTLYNQTPVTVTYGQTTAGTGKPVRDDLLLRNDMTVTRDGGSSGQVTEATGPRGSDRVGLYDSSVTLSLYSDDQTEPVAAWLVHLGTTTDPRYPSVVVSARAHPELAARLAALDIGDRLQITDVPLGKGPPGVADMMVQGITEILGPTDWRFTLTGTPARPWSVAVLDDPVLGRGDTDGSRLAAAVTATDTLLPVLVTAGPPWIESASLPTHFPFEARVGGEVITVTACGPWISDPFARTTANGWGTAPSGQAWTTSGGAVADYSTNGTTGRASLTSVNVARATVIGSALADVDAVVSCSTSALATGASHLISLVGRWTGSGDFMAARLELMTSGAIKISLRKRVAGTDTELSAATTTLTYGAGTLLRVRFQAAGTAFKAKVWTAAGAEPDRWDTAVTDASITAAGQVGVRSVLSTGTTNALPVTAVFDDFALLNPQVFTAVRSANGVSKAQTAGTAVELATPLVLAL